MESGKQSMQWRPSQRAQLLAPFDHQVAGQSSMLVYDSTTLCKPLIPREHFVYQTLPSELQEFTPQYRGEILVKLVETEGNIQLVGHAVGAADVQDQASQCTSESETDATNQECGGSCGGSSAHRPDASHAHGSSEASAAASELDLPHEGADQWATSVSTMSSAASHLHPQTHNLNPWSMKNHKRLLEKMRKSSHRKNKTRFMLLGNVVAGFKKPCILDLKIGSRLHGDDASSTKVASQTGKCKNTTSSTLAVRLCGMQVYQVTTGQYISLDKYHGRKLTVETLQQTLRDFLHNGVHFRQELIQPIISRLAALIACVRKLGTYRFYASSLLIMYDGELEGESTSLSYSSTADKHKHRQQSHKHRAKGFELKGETEDCRLPSVIPKFTCSTATDSKLPESPAASHPSYGIYASTSATSVHHHPDVPSVQKLPVLPGSLSCHTITQNAATSENPQALSSSLSCPNVCERSVKNVKCTPGNSEDGLEALTSPEQCDSVLSFGKRDNAFYMHLPEDCVDHMSSESSQKQLISSPHSYHFPTTQSKHLANGKTPYSTDVFFKASKPSPTCEVERIQKSSDHFGKLTVEDTEADAIADSTQLKHSLKYVVKKEGNGVRCVPLKGTLSDLNRIGQTRAQGLNLKVDVKMIDFAHTTHSGFLSDKIRHSGPDEDYIKGLENLQSLFGLL